MNSKRTGTLVTTLLTAAFVIACGGDDESVLGQSTAETCSQVCNKFSSCNLLLGASVSQCVAACDQPEPNNPGGDTQPEYDNPGFDPTGGAENDPECNPTFAEVDTCWNDFLASSCTDLQNQITPASCDICDEGSPGTGGGGGTGGNGNENGGGTGGTGGTEPPQECADLALCCAQLGPLKAANCNYVVSQGAASSCTSSLEYWRSTGECS